MTTARSTRSSCSTDSRRGSRGSRSCASARISAKRSTISIPENIARYGKRERARLMKDDGIIRSNAKIDAAIAGARLWLDIMEKEPGGFSELIWKHVDGKPKVNRFRAMKRNPGEDRDEREALEGFEAARLQVRADR